jgi:hypothetical protein
MKPPDDPSIETLLRGSIHQPSGRFEAALRAIPGREQRRGRLVLMAAARTFAVAAALVFALTLFVESEMRTGETRPPEQAMAAALDEDWIELFSLADSVARAEGLTGAESRFALEYFAFNQ